MSANAMLEKPAAPQNVVATPEPTRSGRTYVPAVDIIEKADEFVLFADVPGAIGDRIDVNYENGLLTLRAGIDPSPRTREGSLLREYGVGDFERSFRVGEGIDASRIDAELRSGVLSVHLPKAESIKPRRISVKSE
ncbi:18 kDa heat shock protein [Phycisphaerae bacterium RAS2]|nr:18 kDa heat shock protein [Phycisphaerae bacterium RAS2]